MATPKFTFKQFKAEYPDDAACLLAIMRRRYGDMDACPNCGVVGKLTRIEGRRAFACKEGHHIYPCVGTVFEHSSTPLTQWFHAMYLMTATRNGVSAKEIQRQLGVTYKCAWRIGHQLRILLSARDKANNLGPLSGHVEVDETYVGGKIKTGRGQNYRRNKTVVMGMVQRGGPFKGFVVENNRKYNLVPRVLENVAPGSILNTDELSAYRYIGRKGGYYHVTVNHAQEQWADGIHHTNRIEGFWSHLKRGISSTHVHVSKQHMQKYVDEFAFRYNNRHAPAEMFNRLLAQISTAG